MDAGTSVLETHVNHFVGSLASDDSWSETSDQLRRLIFIRYFVGMCPFHVVLVHGMEFPGKAKEPHSL